VIDYFEFHENPSIWSRAVRADGQTDGRTDRRTDMTKVIVAFRNFASAPKTGTEKIHLCLGPEHDIFGIRLQHCNSAVMPIKSVITHYLLL
jgi:Fe-S-cluster formation regulator IscX/YfhJ